MLHNVVGEGVARQSTHHEHAICVTYINDTDWLRHSPRAWVFAFFKPSPQQRYRFELASYGAAISSFEDYQLPSDTVAVAHSRDSTSPAARFSTETLISELGEVYELNGSLVSEPLGGFTCQLFSVRK